MIGLALSVFCSKCLAENSIKRKICIKCGATLFEDDKTYVEKLIQALNHPVPSTVINTAWVLGRRKEASAVTQLIHLIENNDDMGVISAAVETLGEIADPRAVPMFSRLIEHSYLEVRLKTVEALTKIRTNEAVKQLKKALDDQNTVVRRAAQKALDTCYSSTYDAGCSNEC